MFTLRAYQNPYLRVGQTSMQAVLSLNVDANAAVAPAPLALGIALDRSASMEGSRMRAARDGAVKVVNALDSSIVFLVLAFNDSARVLFGPAPGTPENKRRAIAALQSVFASGGTRMSTALNAVVDKFASERSRAVKVLFLTDGKNEGEPRIALDRAVDRCTAAHLSINAWGVGTDWDASELLHMADATHGMADIIPTPNQVEAAFTAAFNEMRKTAITNTHLQLWTPVGVTVKQVQQVYPNLVTLNPERDPASPRQVLVSLGSFAPNDQREYLLDIEMQAYPPGQQFLMVRPSLRYSTGGTTPVEEKGAREGWVFVQWTEESALASQIEQHIAHYTHQEELARNIQEGQAALSVGDSEKATRLLGQALEMSERTGNQRMTKLLSELVHRDAKGTVRLNQQADAVARKTLAINVGRTTKLNG